MSNVKISALPAAASLAGDEPVPVVQAGVTVQSTTQDIADLAAGTTFANPTATLGLSPVNGVAATAMRSDAAPQLSEAISPTWSQRHDFTGGVSRDGDEMGFLGVPQTIVSGPGDLDLTDDFNGRHLIYVGTSTQGITVPLEATTSLPIGYAVTVINGDSTGTATMDFFRESGVELFQAGGTTDADYELSAMGLATLLKIDTDRWIINGTPLAAIA